MQTEQLLHQLFEKKALNQQQTEFLFTAIVRGQLDNSQLSAALIALKLRGETLKKSVVPSPHYKLMPNPFPFQTTLLLILSAREEMAPIPLIFLQLRQL